MGKPIAILKEEAECPFCDFQFTAELKIQFEDQKEVEVVCNRCNETFYFPLYPIKFEVDSLKSQESQKEEGIDSDSEDVKEESVEEATDTPSEDETEDAIKCGNCGSDLVDGECRECHMDVKDFVAPSEEVPKSLWKMANLYMFGGVVLVGIILWDIFLYKDMTIFVLLSFMALVSFGYAFYSNIKIDQIRNEGLASCGRCGRKISPDSRFCTFCGKKTFWYHSRRSYTGIMISLLLVLALVMAVVAAIPPHITIEKVDYPYFTQERSLRVEITILNEWGQTAKANELEIKVYGDGLIPTIKEWHEDIPGEGKSTMTVEVPFQYNAYSFSVKIKLFYKGEIVDKW